MARQPTTRSNDQSSDLSDAFEGLDDRVRQVLIMRFGLEGEEARTLEEVAERLDRTGYCISQLEAEALTILGPIITDVECLDTPLGRMKEAYENRHAAVADQYRLALESMDDQERAVIRSFGHEDGKNYPVVEVAEQLGVTEMGVRQIERLALGKLFGPNRLVAAFTGM